ncbi:DUF4291 family protein [Spirillospora albida]|uniref:DUF4291 family protein n=1 Tax=Spirillospora albida TaxID=58123 RepID=UPI0012FAE1A9|nr:DUF4291 family protein [Spirillospora albida]
MRTREIRAGYDRDSITVCQAYGTEIGRAAVEHGTFVLTACGCAGAGAARVAADHP